MMHYLGTRDEKLPAKFTKAERDAYKWLWDCGIDGWVVDLATKKVKTTSYGAFAGLVEFRRAIEEKARNA